MLKRLQVFGLAATLFLGASVGAVEAAPIQGGFSITGNFLPVIGATGASTTLGLATGLDFINFFGSAATPGVAGTVVLNSGSGDFASLAGTAGTIRDFTFAGPGSASYPTASLLAFQSYPVGALTFDLLSVAVLFQSSNVLALGGAGVFHMAGFDATNGTFNFSGNGASSTFSFSASQGATTAVPEPASLLALAVGLFAGGGYLRRRMKNV
jgi:hypothetical protein